MIKGLIFDFDGLMVDTESAAYQSWLEVYGDHQCEFPLALWCATLGGSGQEFDPCSYLEANIGRMLDRQTVLGKRLQRKSELAAAQPLAPGVSDYVGCARALGLRLAVASSSAREWVVGHLQRLGIADVFDADAIVCREDVVHVKPDPEIYRTALDRLGLGPQEGIAFEDAPNGLLAAKRAGLFCVVVPNPITGRLPLDTLDTADLRLASLADLPLPELLGLIDKATNPYSP